MNSTNLRRSAHARRRAAVVLAIGVTAGASLAAVPGVVGRAAGATGPGFTHFTVDPNLAGGEPLVTYYTNATNGPDLAYTSHEGTTHLFRDGLVSPDTSNLCSTPMVPPQNLPSGYACSYVNQVNVWTSTNHGQSWTRTTVGPNGVGPTSPFGLGFSDPDWSIDEGGWLYNTGIDLANDSVFASSDGGRTFPVGNNNCHSGDRPWLAGGVSGEVFLATDTTVDPNTNLSSGHEIFHGVISGTAPLQTLTCSGASGQADPTGTGSTGIMDFGAWQTTGTYSASGKLFYDHNNVTPSDGYHGAIIDPAFFKNADSSNGVGISILPNATQAFGTGSTVASFPTQFEVPGTQQVFAHWPSIAIDSQDVVYLVWDTSDGGSNALNNAIMLSTIDLKAAHPAFTTPIEITRPSTSNPPGASVFWPWVAVGSPGNASVVWYQYDGIVNPDQNLTGHVRLYEESIFGIGSGSPSRFGPTDAVGAVIHTGGTCQSGTTCVATGQDRRLGDFFTNAVDENGCVMIATGETTTDPTGAVARPMFIQQTSGTSLTGQSCAALAANAPEVPWAALLVASGGVIAAVLLGRRRTRQAAM
ncbi:MAG TPA: hypothetical protein VII79_06080 [Candidatus Dormibacteraeota bacterium]